MTIYWLICLTYFLVQWLDLDKTLREQGIDESHSLLLKRKFFYSDQNVDIKDPVQLNLLYVQVTVMFYFASSNKTFCMSIYIFFMLWCFIFSVVMALSKVAILVTKKKLPRYSFVFFSKILLLRCCVSEVLRHVAMMVKMKLKRLYYMVYQNKLSS